MNHLPLLLCTLSAAFAACAAPPRAIDVVQLGCLDGQAEPTGSPGAYATLRVGDGLVFDYEFHDHERVERAELRIELTELATSDTVVGEDKQQSLVDAICEQWPNFSEAVRLQHVPGNLIDQLPAGCHRVRVALSSADKELAHSEVEWPRLCADRGLYDACRLLRLQRNGSAVTLTSQDLVGLVTDLGVAFSLVGCADILTALPGFADLDRVAAVPGKLRAYFAHWSFDLPLWDAVAIDGERLRIPLLLRCGSRPVLMGGLECVRADGALSLWSGITRLRLWHPDDPERFVALRLVRLAAAATP